MTTGPKLVLAIVNKWWECDPVLAALLSDAAPAALRDHWPEVIDWPRRRRNPPRGSAPLPPGSSPRPRVVYSLSNTTIELWCISDLLEHLPDEGRYQSSSERKAERLPAMLAGRTPALTIAIGTATVPIPSENWNGTVVSGTNVFAHDGDSTNADSRWTWTLDTLISSSLPQSTFASVTDVAPAVLPRLLPTPRAPSAQRSLVTQHGLVALGNVNVTDYRKYAASDQATLDAYSKAKAGLVAASLDTTHAVVRATLGDSFMFISGIVNRFGQFDEDVGGAGFNSAQNFAGAFNAGVALACMLPNIDAAFGPSQTRP